MRLFYGAQWILTCRLVSKMLRLKNIKLILTSITFLFFTAGSAVFAGETIKDPQKIANKIEARYEKISDLSANFTQTLLIEGFQSPMRSSGKVSIKKPGRFYWEYSNPVKEHVYVDGESVVFYTPIHNQVMQTTLSHLAESRMPLQLLQGATRLSKHFDIKSVQREGRSGDGLVQLSLRPKGQGEDTLGRRIVVDVDPRSYYILGLVINEENGNITTVQFSNISINSGINDSVFECDMPEGVEIIQGLP